jgi:hypothetical protein
MDTDQQIYRSYLLRLWRSKSDGSLSWYALLEDPVNGQRKGFSNLKSMVDYLEAEYEVDKNTNTQLLEEHK